MSRRLRRHWPRCVPWRKLKRMSGYFCVERAGMMRYVDEFRDPALAKILLEKLAQRSAQLPFTADKPMQIMEVCGGHTHAIFKFGLDKLLPANLEFIHGPGCPVCVLPMGRIDACCEIATRPAVIFCTFGDALRVPVSMVRCCRPVSVALMC